MSTHSTWERFLYENTFYMSLYENKFYMSLYENTFYMRTHMLYAHILYESI